MTGPGRNGRPALGAPGAPGEIRSPERDIRLSAGRPRRRILVASRSHRPIRVSSHYPFWRVNPRLEFDRAAAEGYRLDIPAGTSVRWAPGEVKEVELVALRAEAPHDGGPDVALRAQAPRGQAPHSGGPAPDSP